MSSTPSMDIDTGVGFVLSSPYTSVLSLAKDHISNYGRSITDVTPNNTAEYPTHSMDTDMKN